MSNGEGEPEAGPGPEPEPEPAAGEAGAPGGVGMCVQGCVEVGLVDYGKTTYMLLLDQATKRWMFRNVNKPEAPPVTVYVGDLSVMRVREDLLDKTVYIIKSENATVYGFDLDTVIKEFLAHEPKSYNEPYMRPFLKALLAYAEVRKGHVIGGFYPDGFSEGVVEPYPTVAWGCRPKSLEEVIKYIVTNYPVGNRAFALANVALALGKVFSPAVRFARRVFEDRMLVNTGIMRLGKTKLFDSIINLLGFSHDSVYVNGDLAVKTPERIRNMLMETNAPLFIDDIGVKGFEAFSNIVLSIISGGIVGLQANKIGLGFASKFRALRSLMVNTNVAEGKIREVLSRDEITAWVRRVIVLPWREEPLKKGVNEWSGEPINECLRDMWNMAQVREALIGVSHDIIDLAMYVADSIKRLYSVDTGPLLEALRIVEEMSEETEEEVTRRHRPEEMIVAKIYDIARQALGVTNITVYLALKAMYENPSKFDIKVTRSKDVDQIAKDVKEWEDLVRELGYVPEDLTLAPDDEGGGFDKLSDTEKALAYVWWLTSAKRVNRVVIYASSEHGLVQGAPASLFGSPKNTYGGRKGYSVSWVAILRKLLNLPPQEQATQAQTQPQATVGENPQAQQAQTPPAETEKATEST